MDGNNETAREAEPERWPRINPPPNNFYSAHGVPYYITESENGFIVGPPDRMPRSGWVAMGTGVALALGMLGVFIAVYVHDPTEMTIMGVLFGSVAVFLGLIGIIGAPLLAYANAKSQGQMLVYDQPIDTVSFPRLSLRFERAGIKTFECVRGNYVIRSPRHVDYFFVMQLWVRTDDVDGEAHHHVATTAANQEKRFRQIAERLGVDFVVHRLPRKDAVPITGYINV